MTPKPARHVKPEEFPLAHDAATWDEDTFESDWDDEARRKQIVEHTLLKREGEPDDIARTVVFLMNNAQVRVSAAAFAHRLMGSNHRGEEAMVKAAFERALTRPPTKEEVLEVVGFLRRQANLYGGNDGRERALTDFCQVLFGMNDFLYVD